MTKIDIKMMHSKELRELRSMIREELDFRTEIGKEITFTTGNDGGETLPYVDDNTPREELDQYRFNEENWEDEADVRPIYNDAQMLNGTFEGDSISKKKNKKI